MFLYTLFRECRYEVYESRSISFELNLLLIVWEIAVWRVFIRWLHCRRAVDGDLKIIIGWIVETKHNKCYEGEKMSAIGYFETTEPTFKHLFAGLNEYY